MIIGKFEKKTRGTVKVNGVEVLGAERKENGYRLRSCERGIQPTKYSSFEQGINALTNFMSSNKFYTNVVERYNINLHLENLEGHYWYICVS
ncbi:MAG: hypothetical protein QGH83_16145 [Candidatus Pacebacteria bacterium]|jgi:hypothetical protein|nr:hypothetical protein [Candidatus Paceibacterota bacterium]|tara:strand:+ start:307 stop:582 length:276 start_codon:yes stop_codon:yes gene_type:complete